MDPKCGYGGEIQRDLMLFDFTLHSTTSNFPFTIDTINIRLSPPILILDFGLSLFLKGICSSWLHFVSRRYSATGGSEHRRATAMEGGGAVHNRTVEDVFSDFRGRRNGVIKALTVGIRLLFLIASFREMEKKTSRDGNSLYVCALFLALVRILRRSLASPLVLEWIVFPFVAFFDFGILVRDAAVWFREEWG